MPKDNINYSNTIIYKIYCKNKNVKFFHIGHTTNFYQRKYHHKTMCQKKNNEKIYKIIEENGGWENWDMVELAKVNCENIQEVNRLKCNFLLDLQKNNDTSFIGENNNQKLYEICDDKPLIFKCEFCNYLTCKKNNYERHILSSKHFRKKNEQNEQNEQNELDPRTYNVNENNRNEYKCGCGLKFEYKQLYEKHKEICSSNNNETSNTFMLTNLILEIVKQNKELVMLNNEAQKHNQELTNKLVKICNTTNNSTLINNSNNNNKTFNLNMFLNETCKDAMNINDFVDSIELQVSDLEEVGKLGFVEGISNIIVKNLRALDVHKRPVHCADKKREVIYIKDEDRWEKENEEKIKLRQAIKRVALKNEKMLPKYKEQHPGCNYSASKYSDHYSKLVIEALGGVGKDNLEKENKIIKNIAKEVVIDKN